MISGRWRWLGTGLVILTALALTGGSGFSGSRAQRPAGPRSEGSPEPPPAEGGDGFALTLVSPNEPYVAGPRTIAVEPRLTAGQSIAQVDFFIDGKLACTRKEAPFNCQADFGREIRSHTIIVSALTGGGQRARVSFVSRSGDIADTASGPIEVVPAVVRDAAGRPVSGLSVSDFSLTENGVRRPIVHFDSEPAPVSVAMVLHAPGGDAADWLPLLRGAGLLARALPWHHSLALLDGVPDLAAAGAAPGRRGTLFSFDRKAFARQLREIGVRRDPERPDSLAAALAAAVAGLRDRRGARAVVLLAAMPPADAATGEVPVLAAEAPAPDEPIAVTPPADAALRDVLESLKEAHVTLHVMTLGEGPQGGSIALLREAVEASGGEFLAPAEPDGADAACHRITESFLYRYLISYLPASPQTTGWRRISVRVRRSNMSVRAPSGNWIRQTTGAAAR